MATKFTMLFSQSSIDKNGVPRRIGGWSESVYHSDDYAIPSAIHNAATLLCQKRANLLPQNSLIIGSRYTLLDANLIPTGRSRSFDETFPGGAGTENDMPQAAIKYTMRAPAPLANRKELVLRGIPDARIVKGEYHPAAAYDQALRDYLQTLCLNWKFRGRNFTAAVERLESIGTHGNVTTTNNASFAANDRVQLYRCRSADTGGENPIGEFTLRLRVGGERPGLYLEGWSRPLQINLSTGWLKKIVYGLHAQVYDEAEANNPRVCVKKVGKAFFQYAGRRSNSRR